MSGYHKGESNGKEDGTQNGRALDRKPRGKSISGRLTSCRLLMNNCSLGQVDSLLFRYLDPKSYSPKTIAFNRG